MTAHDIVKSASASVSGLLLQTPFLLDRGHFQFTNSPVASSAVN
uniref:Uncharacterized protein n=1 Tax=Anguilla anguilla TaxID=7936 RepID=A0A0E9PF80_ANGAN